MTKTLTALAAAALVAGATLAAPSDAQAQWRRGPGFAAGVIGGLAAGAIVGSALAPRYYYGSYPVYAPQPGYVVVPGYAAAVPGPGCYWAQMPVYDAYGRVVGYRGRPRLFCA
jgi:hypothetical protein